MQQAGGGESNHAMAQADIHPGPFGLFDVTLCIGRAGQQAAVFAQAERRMRAMPEYTAGLAVALQHADPGDALAA